MYNRRTLAGEFTCVNKYLLKDLTERNLWTADIRNQLIAAGGSVQNISEIPQVTQTPSLYCIQDAKVCQCVQCLMSYTMQCLFCCIEATFKS
jgi:Ribonucleotide reductase, barrel domain